MKFRLKLTGAAMLLGAIVSHGADAPAFRYSGTAAERALLNNMSALMFGGNAIRCALSTRDLPEGGPARCWWKVPLPPDGGKISLSRFRAAGSPERNSGTARYPAGAD